VLPVWASCFTFYEKFCWIVACYFICSNKHWFLTNFHTKRNKHWFTFVTNFYTKWMSQKVLPEACKAKVTFNVSRKQCIKAATLTDLNCVSKKLCQTWLVAFRSLMLTNNVFFIRSSWKALFAWVFSLGAE